jgi:hypothetical protein
MGIDDNRPSLGQSFKGTLAFVATYVTVFVGTVYALGLFAVWLPLGNALGSHTSGWYAVSLMPRTVVIGEGLRHFLWPPLPVTIFITFALFIAIGYIPVMSLLVIHSFGRGFSALAENPRPGLTNYLKTPTIDYHRR